MPVVRIVVESESSSGAPRAAGFAGPHPDSDDFIESWDFLTCREAVSGPLLIIYTQASAL